MVFSSPIERCSFGPSVRSDRILIHFFWSPKFPIFKHVRTTCDVDENFVKTNQACPSSSWKDRSGFRNHWDTFWVVLVITVTPQVRFTVIYEQIEAVLNKVYPLSVTQIFLVPDIARLQNRAIIQGNSFSIAPVWEKRPTNWKTSHDSSNASLVTVLVSNLHQLLLIRWKKPEHNIPDA